MLEREHGVAAAVLARTGRWSPEKNVWVCDPSDAAVLSRRCGSPSPQVVIAYNDKAALVLRDSMRRVGCGMNTFEIAGFDDIPDAATAEPPLTTMRQPVDAIASVALHTLVSRIKEENIGELIFALGSSPEADSTVLMIDRMQEGTGVKPPRLARGIPMGSDLEFVDEVTMLRAFENRGAL